MKGFAEEWKGLTAEWRDRLPTIQSRLLGGRRIARRANLAGTYGGRQFETIIWFGSRSGIGRCARA